jgi:hypothetical protein
MLTRRGWALTVGGLLLALAGRLLGLLELYILAAGCWALMAVALAFLAARPADVEARRTLTPLRVQAERVVGNDNTVRYEGRVLQIPEQRHRRHFVKANVRVHEYPDGRLAIFHGPLRLADYEPDGTLVDPIRPARTAA